MAVSAALTPLGVSTMQTSSVWKPAAVVLELLGWQSQTVYVSAYVRHSATTSYGSKRRGGNLIEVQTFEGARVCVCARAGCACVRAS